MAQTVVVDNSDPEFTSSGSWSTGTAQPDKYGANYYYATVTNSPSGAPTATAEWRPNLPASGYYYVSIWYPASNNRAPDSPFTVAGDTFTTTIRLNQQANGGFFYYIGQFPMEAGNSSWVSLGNNATKGAVSPTLVLADAVQFDYAGLTPGPGPSSAVSGPEYRGLWVSRFEWPQGGAAATKSMLDTIVSSMATAHFNALFMQVRGGCETLYPSPNEPWGSQFSGADPGFDPMAYAIAAAHSRGIEFHAYINTHVIYQTNTSNSPPPHTTPEHPFWLHANPADPDHREWCYHTADGAVQALGAGEERYLWAAPGVPSYTAWVRQQIAYAAANYPLDGVHFDRIRTAGDGSHDPISLARQAGPGNPNGLAFQAWTQDQISRFCNDVYGAVAEINANRAAGKPIVKVSSAPYYGKDAQLKVNQDVNAWTSLGAMDFIAPQVYTSDVPTFQYWVAANFPFANGRFVVGGMNRGTAGSTGIIFNEVRACREIQAAGSLVFSYSKYTASEWVSYAANLYGNVVSPPEMPWLTSPTDAIIVGNVARQNGEPVVDARITRTGTDYTWLSGGDGFYAMLKVPANAACTLTASKSAFSTETLTLPALPPGAVRRANIVLNPGPPSGFMLR